MKRVSIAFKLILATLLMLCISMASAEDNKPVTHVVMAWLKVPGNEAQRKAFVKASNKLNNLPGIIHRHVGVVRPSGRKIADDSFDVAVTVTMKNKAALTAYLNHPKHKRILEKQLKPLIDKVVAYDFMSQ